MALCVDVIPSSCCNVLKVSDSSTFTTEVVTGRSLSITSPGFTTPVVFSGLTAGFINNYNSVNLGISTTAGDIPDGIYTIVLSATINSQATTYTKKHLHVCQAMTCYYDLLCKIQNETCEPSSAVNTKLRDLSYIRMLIDAAIAKAEYCDAADQATELLAYANKLITKYKTGNCITC
jgi:hypothetical protein